MDPIGWEYLAPFSRLWNALWRSRPVREAIISAVEARLSYNRVYAAAVISDFPETADASTATTVVLTAEVGLTAYPTVRDVAIYVRPDTRDVSAIAYPDAQDTATQTATFATQTCGSQTAPMPRAYQPRLHTVGTQTVPPTYMDEYGHLTHEGRVMMARPRLERPSPFGPGRGRGRGRLNMRLPEQIVRGDGSTFPDLARLRRAAESEGHEWRQASQLSPPDSDILFNPLPSYYDYPREPAPEWPSSAPPLPPFSTFASPPATFHEPPSCAPPHWEPSAARDIPSTAAREDPWHAAPETLPFTSRGTAPKCFNCSERGHHYSACPLPSRGTFCYRCGKWNVTVKTCPNCGSAWRAEGPHNPYKRPPRAF